MGTHRVLIIGRGPESPRHHPKSLARQTPWSAPSGVSATISAVSNPTIVAAVGIVALVTHGAVESLNDTVRFWMPRSEGAARPWLLRHAVFLLEVPDHVQLIALDPNGAHQEEHLKRLKQRGNCSAVYRSLCLPASFARVAARQTASSDYLDNTADARGRVLPGTICAPSRWLAAKTP
jgi:hypothetical protein